MAVRMPKSALPRAMGARAKVNKTNGLLPERSATVRFDMQLEGGQSLRLAFGEPPPVAQGRQGATKRRQSAYRGQRKTGRRPTCFPRPFVRPSSGCIKQTRQLRMKTQFSVFLEGGLGETSFFLKRGFPQRSPVTHSSPASFAIAWAKILTEVIIFSRLMYSSGMWQVSTSPGKFKPKATVFGMQRE